MLMKRVAPAAAPAEAVARAPAGEHPAQFFQGAIDPHPGGILGQGDLGTDFTVGSLLKIAQQDSLAVGGVQRVQRRVEGGLRPLPNGGGRRGVLREGHGVRRLLAVLAPDFSADGLGRGVAGAGMQPAGQRGPGGKLGRLPGQAAENRLRHVFRPVGVAPALPKRRVVDQAEVSAHQFGESLLRGLVGVAAQEFAVVGHDGFPLTAARSKTEQRN
jgi:hypothetical protein